MALQSVVEDQHRRQQRSRSSSVDLFELRPGDNRALKRGNYKGSCVTVNRMSLTLVEGIGLFCLSAVEYSLQFSGTRYF